MATATLLPASLRDKLSSLSARIRRLRAARGLSLLVIALVAIAAGAFLADSWLDLATLYRAGILIGGGIAALAVVLLGLVLPCCRRIDSEALAAAVEERYPNLGERLTTSVELSEELREYHGASALVGLLLEETEQHSDGLDFLRAVSPRSTRRVAVIAVTALLAFLLPALFLPAWYRERVERFLFLRAAAGTTDEVADQGIPFSSEPVALTMETTTEIVSPQYAASHQTPAVAGLADFRKALQHSQVRWKLALDRPAGKAVVLWTGPAQRTAGEAKGSSLAQTQTIEAPLATDGRSAELSLPLTREGTYRYQIVLENPHGVRTELPIHKVEVILDRPPEFLKVTGQNDLSAILNYQAVPIQISIKDDIEVAKAEIQLRVNKQEIEAQKLPLDRWGSRTADGEHVVSGSHVLQLGKLRRPDGRELQPGDVVSYRIMAADNRRVADLQPQVVYYPPDQQWRTMRISRVADPLDLSLIAKEHLDLRRVLETARAELIREQRMLDRIRIETQTMPALSDDQKRDLTQVRKDELRTKDDLTRASHEAMQEQALVPIAETIQDIADHELTEAAQAMSDIAKAPEAEGRQQPFCVAQGKFTDAIARIEQLLKDNDRIAAMRTEQMKLELVAEHEQQLADRAAELQMRDPVRDPNHQVDREQLKREQTEVATELQRLADRSDTLRNSLDLLHAEQLKQIAEKAHELAQQQTEVAKDIRKTERDRVEEKLGELARKQQELAEKAAHLAEETKPATETTKNQPLKTDDVKKAAETLKQGDLGEAVAKQEQAARELERHAADLQKAIDLAQVPKEAARQLARIEEALRQKALHTPDPATTEAVEREQQAVQRVARDLSVPPQDQQARKDRQEAAQHADKATEAIRKNDPTGAAREMEEAQKALDRLADHLPSLQQRQQQAVAELGKLKQLQDEIARQTDKALHATESKEPNDPKKQAELARQLQDSARKEADVAERIGKLDTPNQEARQERAKDSLNKALQDLMDARRPDIAASQAEAKRQMDRLEQALQGKKPVDEQARDLAKQQRDLAAQAERVAQDSKPDPAKQQELQRRQEQIAAEAKNLPAPEAPQRQSEAAEATSKALEEAKNNPTSPESQGKMQEAARALERLAHQLKGQETDSERAQRLAQRQAEAAAESERQAKDKSNPPPSAEAERRQQQIAQEVQQIRGGEDAKQEKQKVQQALDKVAKAPNALQRSDAQRQAEDALRDLADKLGKRDEAAKADDLARQQRDLASEAGKPAEGKPEDAAKKAADQQADLARQLGRLDTKGAEKQRSEAARAMEEASKALDQAGKPDEARDALKKAADAVDQLAKQMSKEQAPQTSGKPAQSPQQQAKDLAQNQLDLARATQKATEEAAKQPGDPGKKALEQALGQIAKDQDALNKKASQLPVGDQSKALEQAREAMDQARQGLDKGDASQAQQKQQEAARNLADLAQKLPAQVETARRADPAPFSTGPQSLPKKEQAEQARQLAQEQRQLKDAVQQAIKDANQPRSQEANAQDPANQQQALQQQTGQLKQDLDQLAQQLGRSPEAQEQAQKAAQSAGQAQEKMQEGQAQQQKGNPGQAQEQRDQAAKALERAAQEAQQAAQQMAKTTENQPGNPQAGKTLQQAQGQVNQAQQQLQQGANQAAQEKMAQAAQSLQQLAQQLPDPQGQPNDQEPKSPTQPNLTAQPSRTGIGPGGGKPDLSHLDPEMKKYAGKRWGELPGDLQTKLMKELTAQYGQDYALMIKRYYERLADTTAK